jgi:hypothetical protein
LILKYEKSKNVFEKGPFLCATAEAKAARGWFVFFPRAPKAAQRRRWASKENEQMS